MNKEKDATELFLDII